MIEQTVEPTFSFEALIGFAALIITIISSTFGMVKALGKSNDKHVEILSQLNVTQTRQIDLMRSLDLRIANLENIGHSTVTKLATKDSMCAFYDAEQRVNIVEQMVQKAKSA